MEEMEKEIIYLRNQINMLKICLVITQVSAIIVLVSLLYQYKFSFFKTRDVMTLFATLDITSKDMEPMVVKTGFNF